jgi:hypothetical protein
VKSIPAIRIPFAIDVPPPLVFSDRVVVRSHEISNRSEHFVTPAPWLCGSGCLTANVVIVVIIMALASVRTVSI